MTAFSATNGFSRLNLVFSTAVCQSNGREHAHHALGTSHTSTKILHLLPLRRKVRAVGVAARLVGRVLGAHGSRGRRVVYPCLAV